MQYMRGCIVSFINVYGVAFHYCVYEHRPLKIRTDGSHPRVRELGFIGVLGGFLV